MFPLNLISRSAQVKVGELTVLDHLEELRWRLVRGAIAIMVLSIAAFIYMPDIFQHVILAHSNTNFFTYRMMCLISSELCVDKLNFVLQNKDMSGQFTMHLKSSFITGFILGFPYLVWEIWGYIKPALDAREINSSSKVVAFVPFLFITGTLFGYFILAPLSVNFLANYQIDKTIINQFDVTSYVSTVTMLVLACGLIFQLPVLIYFLAMAGIITPELMKKYRKHAIIIVIVVAGIITPSPDMLSQVIVGIPIYLLYEISIYTAARKARVL